MDEIFVALAAAKGLVDCLVFKGARVLNIRLGNGRQSLDLGSNLRQSFIDKISDRNQQRVFLQEQISNAVERHFERQNPVKFELKSISVRLNPPFKKHPMGWDAFLIKLNIHDLARDGARGLPGIEIDVASPEGLLETSVTPITIGNHDVFAYSLERIAGEKMRAFLSSLPTYRVKLQKPGDSVRAKDLYDLARIQHVRFLGRSRNRISRGLPVSIH